MAVTNLGYNRALVPAGTVLTATGTSAAVEYDNRTTFRGFASVTALSGSGASITVSIDTSYDNGATDPWRSVGTFPALTAVGVASRKSLPGLDRWVRASWTIAGTNPSLTVEVAGEIV